MNPPQDLLEENWNWPVKKTKNSRGCTTAIRLLFTTRPAGIRIRLLRIDERRWLCQWDLKVPRDRSHVQCHTQRQQRPRRRQRCQGEARLLFTTDETLAPISGEVSKLLDRESWRTVQANSDESFVHCDLCCQYHQGCFQCCGQPALAALWLTANWVDHVRQWSPVTYDVWRMWLMQVSLAIVYDNRWE